jgi:hypothetical protein
MTWFTDSLNSLPDYSFCGGGGDDGLGVFSGVGVVFYFLFVVVVLDKISPYSHIAQAGLKLTILLPQPPKC